MEEELLDSWTEPEQPRQMLPRVEATLLSVWRRTLVEGSGPELTLAEAAALLGSSVESVRRRIKAGQIQAFRDRKGRIRINASVTYDPAEDEELPESANSEAFGRMWADLKAARSQLEAALAENRRLAHELKSSEKALEYTKTELSNLWRAMTTRSAEHSGMSFGVSGEASERGKVLDFAQERLRIQEKITSVRAMARRRKWPWPQAG